ncbi:hypothetical protein [Dactylosporangium sp. CS-033363]|uniref:hypothetical protein n=1 Tax=Dactylosporangium sp. CS-033363 TaxID=3239935 RepID=UPI003D94A1FB
MQRIAGWTAVGAALVYIGVKVLWIAGSDAGVRDLHGTTRAAWVADNVVTGLLGVAAAAVALAAFRPWGRRLPAWLVVGPMWIGGGLLAPLVVLLPVLAVMLLFGWYRLPPVDHTEPELAPWVFVVVYGSFVVLGVALIVALLGYARERFGAVLRERAPAVSPTRAAQLPLAWFGALLALGLAGLRLVWAAGPGSRDAWMRLTDAMTALQAVAAAAGLLAIVHGWAPRRPFAVPLLAAWLGAGGLLAAGALSMPGILSGDGWAERGLSFPQYAGVTFLGFVAGGLITVVTAFAAAERGGAVSWGTSPSR